jgi:hypothetical protein
MYALAYTFRVMISGLDIGSPGMQEGTPRVLFLIIAGTRHLSAQQFARGKIVTMFVIAKAIPTHCRKQSCQDFKTLLCWY